MKMGKTMNMPVIMVDFGGVYFRRTANVERRFEKKLGIPHEKFHAAMMGKNWKAYAEGKINDKQYWKNFCRKLGISWAEAMKFRDSLYSYQKHKKGMKSLVRRIKKRYRIVIFSSHVTACVDFLEKKYKISREFHECHYTFDHGIDKPGNFERQNAKFFRSVVRKMKVKSKDCIVIDDHRCVLEPIKKAGARTILFKDAKQAEKELEKMGVKI